MCFEAKLTSAINLIYFGAKTKPGSEWSFHKKFSESGGTTFRQSEAEWRKVVPPESKNLCVERSVNLSEPDFHIFDKKLGWKKKKTHKRKMGDIFIVKGADNRINSYCRVLGNSLKIGSCNFLFRKP